MIGTSHGQFERAQDGDGFRVLNRILFFVIIVGLCVGGVIATVPIYKQYRDQNARIAQLETELTKKKDLHTKLARKEQLLKTDPAYLEIVSRDRLDVMKPGETIINLEPPKTAASPTPAKN